MKQTKITCDMCGTEINDDALGIGSFQYIRRKEIITNNDQGNVIKKVVDLCVNCCEKVDNFVVEEIKRK